MFTSLGRQVDAWGAFIPGRAGLCDELKEKVKASMQNRGIKDLSITEAGMKAGGSTIPVGEFREHIIIEQKLSVGGTATVALRVAPRGTEDLELSWRLMEKNWATWLLATLGQTGLIVIGLLWIFISLILIPIGVGVCMLIPGVAMIGVAFGWWGVNKTKSQATTYEQFDSRVLAQTVDYCLMSALDELGVTAAELRVLQKAQMGGIGQLGSN